MKAKTLEASSYNKMLADIDSSIKGGKIKEAKKLLKSCLQLSTTLQNRIKLAQFYRRLDQPTQAVHLLERHALDHAPTHDPKDRELYQEYGISLLSLGHTQYGMKWIKKFNLEKTLKTKMAFALSLIRDHELIQANIYIQRLLKEAAWTPYDRLILSTNLLIAKLETALNSSSQKDFEQLWYKQYSVAQELNAHLILNSLELIWLQYCFFSKQFKKIHLSKIKLELGPLHKILYQFYEALILFSCSRVSQRQFYRLVQPIRTQALKSHYYEVVREIDYHSCIVHDKAFGVRCIYHGTQSPAYKNKILKTQSLEYLGEDYIVFDVKKQPAYSVTRPKTKLALKPNDWCREEALLNAFRALCEERYSPLTALSLWKRIFPQLQFEIRSSRNAVYQLIRRLKYKISELNIPLTIIREKNGYQLLPLIDDSISIKIPQTQSPYQEWLNRVKTSFKTSSHWGISELSKQIPNTPRRTHQYYLKIATQSQDLIKTGSHKSSMYQISKKHINL